MALGLTLCRGEYLQGDVRVSEGAREKSRQAERNDGEQTRKMVKKKN
jgi:hypothetical protein